MNKYKAVMLKTIFPDTKVEKKFLGEASIDFVLLPNDDEATILKNIADADAIITVYTPVTEKIMDVAKKCKIIMRTGQGVDNVDIPAASRRGIYVANVPDFCVDEVADHTLGLALLIWRKLNYLSEKVTGGGWGWDMARPIKGIKGSIYGIVGFGKIGREVAKRAQAFGFKIAIADPFVTQADAQKIGAELMDLDKLLATADIISVHAPLAKSTYHMFNEATFKKMKKTALLVNVARGSLVDQKAIYNALKQGQIAGAALDVFEQEPPQMDDPIFTLPNVIFTPHVAGYSESSELTLRERFSREVIRAIQGKPPESWVNRKEMGK